MKSNTRRISLLFLCLMSVVLLLSLMLGACTNDNEGNTTVTTWETTTSGREEISTALSETTETTDTTTVLEEVTTNDGIFRFGVFSDTHIGQSGVKSNMEDNLKALDEISSGKTDLILVAGDLTDTMGIDPNSTKLITNFLTCFRRANSKVPFLFCLGPTHDLPVNGDCVPNRQVYSEMLGGFENDLSADTYAQTGVRHAVFGDYHFFTVDHSPSDDGVAYLKNELTALTAENADKPIFVIMHDPNQEIGVNVFKDFPQAIVFSGHVHSSSAREDSIKQDRGYTQVHCGGTAYYRVDGYNRFNSTTNPFYELGNTYDFAQSLYVEVKGNEVKIVRVDGRRNTTFGEEWIINSDRRNVYTDARKANALPCEFAEDAEITVEESGESTVKITFGPAKSGDAGPALYYRVELIMRNESGAYTTVSTKDLSSKQVFYPNDIGIPEDLYKCTFKDVDLKDYIIKVHAVDCWQTSKTSLSYRSAEEDTTTPTNVAFGKNVTVTANASLTSSQYSPSMLTDGIYGYYSNQNPMKRGWHMATDFVPSAENPLDIVIDLEKCYDISMVTIHPITSYVNVFPVYFEYQVSESADGDDWTTVKVNENIVCNGRLSSSAKLENYNPDARYDVTFETPVKARRFRIRITTPAVFVENGKQYMGFGEVEIIGTKAS